MCPDLKSIAPAKMEMLQDARMSDWFLLQLGEPPLIPAHGAQEPG